MLILSLLLNRCSGQQHKKLLNALADIYQLSHQQHSKRQGIIKSNLEDMHFKRGTTSFLSDKPFDLLFQPMCNKTYVGYAEQLLTHANKGFQPLVHAYANLKSSVQRFEVSTANRTNYGKRVRSVICNNSVGKGHSVVHCIMKNPFIHVFAKDTPLYVSVVTYEGACALYVSSVELPFNELDNCVSYTACVKECSVLFNELYILDKFEEFNKTEQNNTVNIHKLYNYIQRIIDKGNLDEI